MLKQFAQKIEEMRRLIDDSRSASVSVGPGGSQGDRKNPSHFVGPSPCGQGGSTLPVPLASPRAPQYLLAVSGGMDSMCMADLFLQTLGAESFAIAHCNFSLRGEESDGDEALVREWAGLNDVQLFVKRFDTESYAREKGISIEMAARDLRYGWFAQLCQEHGFAALSVAHNANDNAETLFLNLLRGTGLNGLHGMADLSTLSVADSRVDRWSELAFSHPRVGGGAHVVGGGQWRPLSALHRDMNVVLYRPLLEFTRKQIEGYVFVRKVPYRHDSSNFESDYKRNKIRNEVFPVFEKINPSFIRTLNREIGYFAEAGSIVEDWCKAHVADVVTADRHLSIDTAALLAAPYWRYLLYYILYPYGFNSQTLASIESLLTSERTVSGKRFESQDYVLLTGRDSLDVIPKEDSATENSDPIMVVRGSGIYNFNGARFSVEILPWSSEMPLKQPQGVLVMDADKMKFPFVCRRWRQGDWLVPLGMKGKKKVSDLFADLKYDTLAKDAAIIMVDTQTEGLSDQQHIAGLLGVRIDDRYKVTSVTKNIIRVECK